MDRAGSLATTLISAFLFSVLLIAPEVISADSAQQATEPAGISQSTVQQFVEEPNLPLAQLRITVSNKGYPNHKKAALITTQALKSRDTQSIDVIEGSQVYLWSEPALSGVTVYGLRKNFVFETALNTEKPLGFYLTPRLKGGQAVIEVIAHYEERGKTVAVGTTIIGDLGQWLAVSKNDVNKIEGNYRHDTRKIKVPKGFFIKVELL